MAPKSNFRCDIRASFATAFGNWRRKKKIPLKKISKDLGLAVSTINSWELGERFPTGRNFEMLVDYTGVPPCRLFCVMAAKCVRADCLLAVARKPYSAGLSRPALGTTRVAHESRGAGFLHLQSSGSFAVVGCRVMRVYRALRFDRENVQVQSHAGSASFGRFHFKCKIPLCFSARRNGIMAGTRKRLGMRFDLQLAVTNHATIKSATIRHLSRGLDHPEPQRSPTARDTSSACGNREPRDH